MKSQKYIVFLTPNERSLAVHCLVELRNRLISDGRYTDAVDELLEKISQVKRRRPTF